MKTEESTKRFVTSGDKFFETHGNTFIEFPTTVDPFVIGERLIFKKKMFFNFLDENNSLQSAVRIKREDGFMDLTVQAIIEEMQFNFDYTELFTVEQLADNLEGEWRIYSIDKKILLKRI